MENQVDVNFTWLPYESDKGKFKVIIHKFLLKVYEVGRFKLWKYVIPEIVKTFLFLIEYSVHH